MSVFEILFYEPHPLGEIISDGYIIAENEQKARAEGWQKYKQKFYRVEEVNWESLTYREVLEVMELEINYLKKVS